VPRIPSHVIGFDDAPFEQSHRGDVLVVGTIYSGKRLEGILSTRVRRDGINSTSRLASLISGSRFAGHIQVILLQGIAFAGFNVVDIHALYKRSGLPVIVVSRKRPNLKSIRNALLNYVPGGRRKWHLIEQAGRMERLADLWVQRVGIGQIPAEGLLQRLQINAELPEPLRLAHMIAGGVTTGESRHRP